MTDAFVGVDILEAFDVVGYEAPEVTFNGIFRGNNVVEFLLFSLGEIFHPSGRLDFGLRKDGFGSRATNSVDISQSNPDLFLGRDDDTGNSSHILTLPLLVLRFFLVDDVENAFAANEFVIRRDFFHTGTYLHSVEKSFPN